MSSLWWEGFVKGMSF